MLNPDELARLAERVAAQPERWAQYGDPHATERTYAALHRDADVDVWAIFWLPENDTGWHDHDTSSGAVHVVEGALEEHALLLGAPERRKIHLAGSTFSFGPSHIHRLSCSVARAVSIHAYSPPLWRLGQYSVDAERVLHRVSVSYADELRPL
jgi:Cysteine dioxygenase type I